MARGRWKVAWAVAALVLIGSACSGGDGDGQATGETKEPIVIGASLPLTGEFSQPGGAAKRGYDVWVELVNEKGGILGRPVRLTVLDDASEQNTVVADYNRLITRDKVDLLLGTFSSLLNLPASAVAERNRMLYVEPAGGAPALFERGFRYLFFAQQATAPHQADVFVDWINSLPAGQQPKTAAYPTQDDPYAKGVGEANTEGVFYTVSWSPEATYPLNQEFVQRYRQKFNQVPEEDAADAFAAAQVLHAAAQAVGAIDQDKMAEWLHANQVDTILGPLRWDQTGAPQSDFLLAQWQNGKSEIVLPKDVATTDSVVLPKPDWKTS